MPGRASIGVGWKIHSQVALVFGKSPLVRRPRAHSWPDFVLEEKSSELRRAELPDRVADWAVAPWAAPGERFLDPFSGHGSLCRAAERAGMIADGIEIDRDNGPLVSMERPEGEGPRS